MDKNEKWLQWAVELQSLAQTGLFYGKDDYDMERYERIREISAEMISYQSEIPVDKVKELLNVKKVIIVPGNADENLTVLKEL